MEAMAQVVRRELGIKPLEVRMARRAEESEDCAANCRYEVRIAESEGELVELLSEGWDLVKELSSGKFVLRRIEDRKAGSLRLASRQRWMDARTHKRITGIVADWLAPRLG